MKKEQAGSLVERELSIINQGAQVLAELTGRIGAHFRRAEVRRRVGHYRYCPSQWWIIQSSLLIA